jgi:hypothetical protein
MLIDRFFQHIGYIIVNHSLRENNEQFRFIFLQNTSWQCYRMVRPDRKVVIKGTLRMLPAAKKKKKIIFEAALGNAVKAYSEALIFF